ncbi:hypothetical protein [Sphingobium fluviale]|uniref:Uncharacterized protein n=1 Tax=Sphingobium fluviale TaxID=2506423 RepID=A0A4Q1KMA5_9SPHN|nr:hypothetical protein [Sphingobium fluviale]RXR31103.1 hypothetical protein EQG66_02185 [Sphingobium fluviale]
MRKLLIVLAGTVISFSIPVIGYAQKRKVSSGAVPANLIGTSMYCSVHTYNQELFGGATRRRDAQPDEFRVLFTGPNEITIRGSDGYANGVRHVRREGRDLVISFNANPQPGPLGSTIGWESFPKLNLDTFEWEGQWYTIIMGVKGMKYDQGSCE